MGFFTKLIFTGLGWTLGGPIGGIIGYVIGSLFSSDDNIKKITDSSQTNQTNYDNYSNSTNKSQSTAQNDFRVALLILISCVMKADGHIKKSELEVVKSFLLRNYGEEDAKEALQVLKKLLSQEIDVVQVAMQISQNVNYSTKLEIIHLLLDIAHADGEIDQSELNLIKQISTIFKIIDSDLNSLLALFGKGKDPDWAYKALEIERTATDEEVKKAYRRMAMKYHPDKVASAGEEVKQKATEKFRAINDAYEEIKSIRNIK